MLQTASWKIGLVGIVLALLLPAVPIWSQTTTAPTSLASSSDAKSYVGFGIANGQKGDLGAAITAFNQAISIDPKYAPAYFYRGLAYATQNQPDQAVVNYDQAIQLDPAFKQAYYQRGSLKGQKGDFDSAINDFNEVIKLDPKYAPAYYQSGHVQYFKGDLDGAFTHINQALGLDPNFAFCYFVRGLIDHAQGRRGEALSDFQKSSGLNFPYGAFWVWICETETGQHGLARQDLSDALNKPQSFKPDDFPSTIGSFLLEKTTLDQLLAWAKTDNAAQINDQVCKAWFYAGMCSRLSGDPKGAQANFAKAVATNSTGSEEFVEASRQLAKLQQP
jgi:tetratricopeptide (TPR) repeat protein